MAVVAADMKDKIAALQGEIDSQKALLAALMGQVKDCCKNDTALALWVADLVRQEMAGVSIAAFCLISCFVGLPL